MEIESRIVIFANGELHQPDLLKRHFRPGDRIFCADGGTRHALALGLKPERIIGDLDSLPETLVQNLRAQGVIIERHPRRKDQTDLELAFRRAAAEDPAEIMLATALGGRLDQMLANILLLTAPEYAGIRLTLVDGNQWAAILRPGVPLVVRGHPGDTLSVVPLTPTVTGVTLRGVEWPLDRAVLSLGSTWTISNEMTAPEAQVSLEDGLALVVVIQ